MIGATPVPLPGYGPPARGAARARYDIVLFATDASAAAAVTGVLANLDAVPLQVDSGDGRVRLAARLFPLAAGGAIADGRPAAELTATVANPIVAPGESTEFALALDAAALAAGRYVIVVDLQIARAFWCSDPARAPARLVVELGGGERQASQPVRMADADAEERLRRVEARLYECLAALETEGALREEIEVRLAAAEAALARERKRNAGLAVSAPEPAAADASSDDRPPAEAPSADAEPVIRMSTLPIEPPQRRPRANSAAP